MPRQGFYAVPSSRINTCLDAIIYLSVSSVLTVFCIATLPLILLGACFSGCSATRYASRKSNPEFFSDVVKQYFSAPACYKPHFSPILRKMATRGEDFLYLSVTCLDWNELKNSVIKPDSILPQDYACFFRHIYNFLPGEKCVADPAVFITIAKQFLWLMKSDLADRESLKSIVIRWIERFEGSSCDDPTWSNYAHDTRTQPMCYYPHSREDLGVVLACLDPIESNKYDP